jgi:multiple sugar transport system ATP-binding protein
MDSMAAAVQSFRSDELIFGIRPEDISCKEYEEKSSGHWEPIEARVNVVETLGKETYLDLSSGQSPITAIVSPDISIKPDEVITLVLNMHKIHLFQEETGQAIF